MDLEVPLLALQLLVQFAAAFYSYLIYKTHRRYWPWLAITLALVLMSLRRVAALFLALDVFPGFDDLTVFLDKMAIPLLVSALFLYAFWSINSEFKSWERTEEKAFQKIRRAVKRT